MCCAPLTPLQSTLTITFTAPRVVHAHACSLMPTNIVAKARLHDVCAMESALFTFTQSQGRVEYESDIFFNGSQRGRLKLRHFKANSCEGHIVYYERTSLRRGVHLCEYTSTHVDEVDAVQSTLEKALGVQGVVHKQRRRYSWTENVRIHIDTIEDLGHFITIHVVMAERAVDACLEQINQIMQKLKIEENDLVTVSYLDLLMHNDESN